MVGLHCHVGSGILDSNTWYETAGFLQVGVVSCLYYLLLHRLDMVCSPLESYSPISASWIWEVIRGAPTLAYETPDRLKLQVALGWWRRAGKLP